ncbi:carbohydrate ABC transporter permease [Neglectibacter caecimuris]|uniref:carbohydrate ABC transporter permease n=1 Tax=Neglectibacter caecimuris TaxID=3093658 RepID=UPI002AC8E245|nr:carbohydrate ABC transporter permease [Neglectibacter sp. M00184]
MKHVSPGRRIFLIVNYTVLILAALCCLLPLVYVLAVSLSSSAAAMANKVTLWPVDFTWKSYQYVIRKPAFYRSFLVAVQRVLLAVPVNMLLTVLVAYPLSKGKSAFRARNIFTWYFVITMLFSGGLIPWFLTIYNTGLIDTIWALVIPGALPVFNMIILMNFFRSLPKELEEAALIDGAGQWTILARIYLPLSTPSLATLILFCLVTNWNSWFDGLILMNNPDNYPLQSYLQTVVVNRDISMLSIKDAESLSEISDRTVKCAQIFIAMIPILGFYPLLQKYFTTGMVLGGVKG